MRTVFDASALQQLGPLGHIFTNGQPVLTRYGLAEISNLTDDGGVVVTYHSGDTYSLPMNSPPEW